MIHISGSSNDIINAALFKQFTEYLENGKSNPPGSPKSKRRKRSTNKDDVTSFLNDMYPGAQQVPTQLVQMLASPQIKPDDKLESTAILHNQYEKQCEKFTPKCPESSFRLEKNGICIHDPKKGMNFEDAKDYCHNLAEGKAKLLRFENLQETKLLFEHITRGIQIFQNTTFSIHIKFIKLDIGSIILI